MSSELIKTQCKGETIKYFAVRIKITILKRFKYSQKHTQSALINECFKRLIERVYNIVPKVGSKKFQGVYQLQK